MGSEEGEQRACIRCGTCCFAYVRAYVTQEDLERWRAEGRSDILSILENQGAVWAGDHFVSAADGHYIGACPFLDFDGAAAVCTIYDTRPLTCRNYRPGSSEICPLWGKKRKKEERKMLIHVVCMKFKEGVTEGEVEKLKKALGALPAAIPEIKGFDFGPDVLHTERSYDFALVASYEDVEALRRYQVHPAHLPVLERVRAMSASLVAVDFQR